VSMQSKIVRSVVVAILAVLSSLAFYPKPIEVGPFKLTVEWTTFSIDGKWGIWLGFMRSGSVFMIHLVIFTVVVWR